MAALGAAPLLSIVVVVVVVVVDIILPRGRKCFRPVVVVTAAVLLL